MSGEWVTPGSARLTDVTVKILFIFALIMLLLIPRFMVESLIQEREQYRAGAVKTITGRWGNLQTLGGPAILVPIETVERDLKGVILKARRELWILPDELSVEMAVAPERRSHGIYDVVVYSAAAKLSGRFGRLEGALALLPAGAAVLWKEAALFVGLEDPRGLRQAVSVVWNGKSVGFEPAARSVRWNAAALAAGIPLSAGTPATEFSIGLDLNGSESIRIIPLGGSTKIRMTAPWRRPYFTGAFLPLEQKMDDAGFEARWQVTRLARGFPQAWLDQEVSGKTIQASALGADFPDPVDVYFVSQRAVKYTILFLTLTFSAFFLFETLARLSLHPVQYFLIGAANVLFYLLLLAISEHLRFGIAYTVAVVGIAGMVTGYSRSILGDWRRAGLIAGLLATLYGWLYVVLMLEDHALLLGAVGLFVALGAFMYLTRNIDWARLGTGPRAGAGPTPR